MEQAERLESTHRRRSRLRGWRLFAVAFLIAFMILVIIRKFFFEVYMIPSESMEPFLQPGDRIIVERVDREVHRGDVIVFDGEGSFAPYASSSPWLTNPLRSSGQWLGITGTDTVYVKRVIGVAGDHVECCKNGKLLVNGEVIDEPYIFAGDAASEQEFSVVVPEGKLWLMGDHRSVSKDSRALLGAPGGGMIRVDKVIGKPVLIALPFERAGSLQVTDTK